MTGVQEWPPGLDHRRPFFDEHPRQGVYLQLSIPVPQMRSGLPSYVPPSAHDSWQVLMFQGQTCSHSRAFTTGQPAGNWAEGSTESAPITELWVQSSIKNRWSASK